MLTSLIQAHEGHPYVFPLAKFEFEVLVIFGYPLICFVSVFFVVG
jgi:hypothetical protein